ncbi:MAG: fluoride efflux transporter CrcB, partial [Gammaproteobacteria bacterium]|nr:fluoride efflux transporter CrcB [Gammaproteobacteria bacterium]
MTYYLAIALGGSAGAVTRYWLTTLVQETNRTDFPLGTFLVNVTGSLLIGIFFIV